MRRTSTAGALVNPISRTAAFATSDTISYGLVGMVPPGASLVVAWQEGSLTREMIERRAASRSQRLILSFNPVGHVAVLRA